MTLNYPKEADFSDLPVSLEDLKDENGVQDALETLREKIDYDSQVGDEYDTLLRVMGLKGHGNKHLLWDDRAYTVSDARNMSHYVVLRDHSEPHSSQYAEYKVEDLDQFISDWAHGHIVPAVDTGEFIPLHEHGRKTYALAGENTQDPQTEYRIIGDPVTINTGDMEDREIFDLVYHGVEDQRNMSTLPDQNDPDLFLIEIEEFDAIRR